jgi:hypothetical protein
VTAATFDGCLGRISDRAERPADGRPARSALTSAQLLALVPSSSDAYEEDPEQEYSAADNDD